jgi:hypothetical protein
VKIQAKVVSIQKCQKESLFAHEMLLHGNIHDTANQTIP